MDVTVDEPYIERFNKLAVQLAGGDSNSRELAIEVYRNILRQRGSGPSPAMKFMSEVDNPCPDFGLRGMYRKSLLACDDVNCTHR